MFFSLLCLLMVSNFCFSSNELDLNSDTYDHYKIVIPKNTSDNEKRKLVENVITCSGYNNLLNVIIENFDLLQQNDLIDKTYDRKKISLLLRNENKPDAFDRCVVDLINDGILDLKKYDIAEESLMHVLLDHKRFWVIRNIFSKKSLEDREAILNMAPYSSLKYHSPYQNNETIDILFCQLYSDLYKELFENKEVNPHDKNSDLPNKNSFSRAEVFHKKHPIITAVSIIGLITLIGWYTNKINFSILSNIFKRK